MPGQPADPADVLGDELRSALGARGHIAFDPALRRSCFVLGALCAKAGRPVPGWLSETPPWAHGAALNGHGAYRRQ
jgi:hypothetical protein